MATGKIVMFIWFTMCLVHPVFSKDQAVKGRSARNWKQCVYKDVNDGRDNGLIKECTFVKNREKTALKVEFNGDLRVAGCLLCCKRWYFTFNDVECNSPLPIDGIHLIGQNHGKTDYNIHKTTHIMGFCEGVDSGTVRVGFNIGDCPGYEPGNGATGFASTTVISIEEVAPPQQ